MLIPAVSRIFLKRASPRIVLGLYGSDLNRIIAEFGRIPAHHGLMVYFLLQMGAESRRSTAVDVAAAYMPSIRRSPGQKMEA